jgi:hypothetical protein
MVWENSYYRAAQRPKEEAELRAQLSRLSRRYRIPEPELILWGGEGVSDCLAAERIRITLERAHHLELCHEFCHALQWRLSERGLIFVAETTEGHGASFVGLLAVVLEDTLLYDAEMACVAAEMAGLVAWEPHRVRELLGML